MLSRDKLFSYKNVNITEKELLKLVGRIEYEKFVEVIAQYVAEKVLEPVRAAGKNGRIPVLYNKYRIIKPDKNYTDVLEDIKLLHPDFNHSKYAKHPEMYIKYKREIDLLSNFLWEQEDLLKNMMSVNERSFQIWGREKIIKSSSIISGIFKYNDWDLAKLNYFETPEPFFEYIFSNEENKKIMIIENKDTWFSLRKIMLENNLNFLYRDYQVLLYGEGKKIIRKSSRLKEYNALLGGSNNTYFYFGDLDYEGIDIFQTLVEYNEGLDINLCVELYSWMLQESKMYELPETKIGQKKTNISKFLQKFKEEEAEQIRNILSQGSYIPQEILNYSLLKKQMEGLVR